MPLIPNDLDPVARAQIRMMVARTAGRWCERDDLAQSLALHVVAQQRKIDSSRGAASTFYATIIRSKATSLYRSSQAARRQRGREAADINPAHLRARTTDVDLRADVRSALDRLPPDCRTVASLLMSGQKMAEIARMTGQPRGRVRGWCMTIQRRLRRLGLAPERPTRRSA